MQQRLQLVGDIERPQHYFLEKDHRCYFWGEYTPWEYTEGKRWDYSDTNRLIANFKKGMDRQGKEDWHHKQEAIQTIGRRFARFWKWQALHERGVILVPVPPSRRVGDPLYDNRITEMLRVVRGASGVDLDVRELLVSNGSIPASHTASHRPSPQQIYDSLSLSPVEAAMPIPNIIYLFDDVLTTGAHFVACLRRLRELYPEQPIIGNFVARCARPEQLAQVPLTGL